MGTRQKSEQDFRNVLDAYKKTFHRLAPILDMEDDMGMGLEEITAILRRCIEEGKPYRLPYPDLSEEKREFIYAEEDYEAMFGRRGDFDLSPESNRDFKKVTEIMRQCMKEGKPFDPPEFPEEADH